jgi:hypothetical protein
MAVPAFFETALSFLEMAEFTVPTFGTAFLLWHLGMHDPFMLTVLSLAVGAGTGIAIHRAIDKRSKRHPDT